MDNENNMKENFNIKSWNCEKCGCEIIENEYDYSLHLFEVYNSKEEFLGNVFPANIKDMKNCIKELDEGGCPVCDGWEDGNGHICKLEGWRYERECW